MTVSVQSVTPAVYDPSLDQMPDSQLLALAIAGNIGAANKVVQGGVDFLVQARSDAAEGPLSVIELMTARGVPFPAGFIRLIDVEVIVSGQAADETGASRYIFTVSGGTTPLVRAGSVLTATPAEMIASQVYDAMDAAGLADNPTVTCTAGAGVVNLLITSAEAEILNWTLRIRIGRLIPMILGV